MGIFTKGIAKEAYRGKLTCPGCYSEAVRFVEDLGLYRKRYRCRKCGQPFQYDISRNVDFQRTHPYALFKKQKFEDAVQKAQLLKAGR